MTGIVKTFVLCVVFLMAGQAFAQRMTVEEYVQTYKAAAIAQMKRLGVPASIILAQGILETENGNSDLVRKSNNHFGIKCKINWTGMSVTHTDDAPNECFRKYLNAEESYRDHSDYLFNAPRYAKLFQLSPTDYKGWAFGLKSAGYATNPRYPQILISNIERYNLQQYNSPDQQFYDRASVSSISSEPKQQSTTTPVIAEPTRKEQNVFKKLFAGRKNKDNQYFNRLKAVMVFSGTSLLAVASENDIPLSKLLEYNDLGTDGLVAEDQWIYLEKKHKEGNRERYEALENETLYNISQNNGIQVALLAQYNKLAEAAIIGRGTVVYLRPGAEALAVAVTLPVTVRITPKLHEVQAKEGLYGIAKQYNVTVDEIRKWNQLTTDDIRLGQQLIIAK